MQSWYRMVLAKIVAKNEGRKEREQALHRNVDARKIQAAFRRRLSATAAGGEIAGSASKYVATVTLTSALTAKRATAKP